MVISYFNYLWDIDGISAGSAIKAKEFIAAIRRQGHSVNLEWRTPQPTSTPELPDKVKESVKPYLQKYLREPGMLLRNFKYIVDEYKILKHQKPDIFFPRLDYGNLSCFLLSKWLKIPTIVEADCPPTHEWKTFYAQDAFKLGNLSLKLELATLQQADAVITQSNQLRDYYVELGMPEKKIHMITNAADINKFQLREKDPELVTKYNLHNKVVIGWISAGVAWTGIDGVIKTIQALLKNNPSVCFLMVGSKQNMDFLRHYFNLNGFAERVVLAGFVSHDDIPRYLSCMDIVMAPYPKMNLFYASSMKLFEYMAAGKAIVATRIGQIAEVINEGRNGFLFEPDVPDELFEKINTLISSIELRKKVGMNARSDAEREWNWDKVGEKMIHVFEDVLNTRNKTGK